MIFCLFGTNPYDFSRLAKAIDEVSKNISEKFLVQSGYTNYVFHHCDSVPFMSHEELIENLQNSKLVICQGGYGSIIEALENNKPVISIPRRPENKESADEQYETVKYFYSKNLIDACFDELDVLESKINDLLSSKVVLSNYSDYLSNVDCMNVKDIICQFLDSVNSKVN